MEIIEQAKKALDKLHTFDQNKQYALMVKGKRVKLKSGKSVWDTRGSAKGALTHFLMNHVNSNYAKLLSDGLLKEGYVKIVEV